jgi:beta-glucosidase
MSLPSTIKADGTISVSVKVTNTGSRTGREVVQLYVTDPVSSLQRPEQELKAFAKTGVLAPGKSETVKLSLDRDAFSYYDDRKQAWVAEQGAFGVRVAASSADVRLTGETTLEQSFTWTGL